MLPLILQAGAGEARLDIIPLILNASPVVKGVLALLILMSVASWYVIGSKALYLSQRLLALEQVPGCLLEDGPPRRNLENERGGAALARQ